MPEASAAWILTFPGMRRGNGRAETKAPGCTGERGVSVDNHHEAGSSKCISKNINFCKQQGSSHGWKEPSYSNY